MYRSECGNGILDDNEECDDGNTQAGDGCDDTCQNEDGLSGGAIAGIVVGALAAAAIMAAAGYWIFGRKRVQDIVESYEPSQSGKELDL